ncbi:MAG: hypothetical protein ACE5HW_02255 [Candidatus Methanofastidiosia archaeon]
MKIRLRTKEKIREEKLKELQKRAQIKRFLESLSEDRRENAQKLLEDINKIQKRQNRWGIFSFLFIGAFFLMYSFGFAFASLFFKLLILTSLIAFIFCIYKMFRYGVRANTEKRKLMETIPNER